MKHSLTQRWAHLSPRDRRALLLAAAVVLAWALWTLALQPALHTLRTAPAARQQAEQAWQSAQTMAREAQALRERPAGQRLSRAATLQALEQTTQSTLGATAVLQPQSDRVLVTLKESPAPDLAEWLQRLHLNAHLRPLEAKLSLSDQGWSGTLVVTGAGLAQP